MQGPNERFLFKEQPFPAEHRCVYVVYTGIRVCIVPASVVKARLDGGGT